MALRAVPDHPKFAHLKALLNLGKGATLGYLECIWHLLVGWRRPCVFKPCKYPEADVYKYHDATISVTYERYLL